MVILVTGAAGFIGSHVAEKLLERGEAIVGVDNLDAHYSSEQKMANIAILKKHDKFTFYQYDIRDTELIRQTIKEHKITKIIHLAAKAGVRPSLKHPLLYEEVNIRGTMILLELACELGIQNFVYASSSSIYGDSKQIPFKEEQKLGKPLSPYSATKRAGEVLCEMYHSLYRLNITCLRFFTVYGPRGRPDMAPFIFTKAISNGDELTIFGDGTSQRDYTFVGDVAAGVIAALDKKLPFAIFNIGNSHSIPLMEFIATLEKVVGKKASIKHIEKQKGDVDITYSDISNARELLGYNPKTELEEGLREFVEWYNKQDFIK